MQDSSLSSVEENIHFMYTFVHLLTISGTMQFNSILSLMTF